MKRTAINLLAATVLVFGATAAFGQTATLTGSASTTGTDNVTAFVNAVCTISNFSLAFGEYNPLATADLDSAAATISVNCTSGINPAIEFAGGRTILNADDGTTTLNYEVFTDSTRTTALVDATPAAMGVSDGSTALTYPLYGRIPALQNVTAGNYAGTLTATINW